MDSELQLNISIPKKVVKPAGDKHKKNSASYSFVSNPVFAGKTLARKRRQPTQNSQPEDQGLGPPPPKQLAKGTTSTKSSGDFSQNLRDLSEDKGKYQDINYQDLNDDLQTKLKPRKGGWISSLFKNNPSVPRVGQRAVKPLVEKVFTGNNFSDLNIHPHSVANLQQNLGLKELMTVQQNASPVMLQGRDVLIRSQTGSGKTLAYALPIIEGLQAIRPKINRNDGIRAVVVVPTRELAVQTYELFVKLVKPFTWVVPGILSGGQKRKAEKAILRKGLSILVGTPGRICDHLRHTQSLNFAKARCLVLDEADRLLDMGYEKDVAAIVKALEEHRQAATYDPMAMVKQNANKKVFNEDEAPVVNETKTQDEKVETKHRVTDVFLSDQRQTVLLSATLTKAVENLAGLTMVDPVFVDTSEGRAVVADSLRKAIGGSEVDFQKAPLETVETEVSEPMDADVSPEKTKKKIKAKKVEEPEEDSDSEASEVQHRKGLKEFGGHKFPELFDVEENDKKVPQVANAVALNIASDSDSDSDYEYFKANKQLSTQKKVESSVDETSETEEQVETSNNFEEALQTALVEDELILPASVKQSFLITPMKLRLVTLCAMIVEHCVINKNGGKMIVFMATQEMVDYHAELFEAVLIQKEVKSKEKKVSKTKSKKNRSEEQSDEEEEESSESDYEVELGAPTAGGVSPVELALFRLHGSMPHDHRISVFQQFRAARAGLLLCTDVAARGLDVPRVDLVLQYCAPASATDYVHRVGRTGRAAHAGAATLLLLPSEADFVRHLEERRVRMQQADDRTVLESLRIVAPGAGTAQRAAAALQAALEHTAHSSREWLARATRAYTSWVRFYAGYPRAVREHLDSHELHLGHAAKAFALRDAPGAIARRAKNQELHVRPAASRNRLTVDGQGEDKRPGFPKLSGSSRPKANKQSSMHTASEFDSGLEPLEKKHKNKKSKS